MNISKYPSEITLTALELQWIWERRDEEWRLLVQHRQQEDRHLRLKKSGLAWKNLLRGGIIGVLAIAIGTLFD